MRALYVGLSLIFATILDSVLLTKVSLFGAVPDCVLVAVVCVGILVGSSEGGLIGFAAGLIQDIVFGRAVGISAMAYMLSGALGGVFYKKYFADNLIIPMVTVAVCAFFKENFMALTTKIAGGNYYYFEMLATYILPCTLFSAILCVPVHLFLKPKLLMTEKKRYDRSTGGLK